MAKILVVDDETDLEILIRQKFRKKIRANEYEFVFAHDGEEALSKVRTIDDVDMVLSDINMPKMDGLTLLGHLKNDVPLVKSVIVSAYGDMENIRTAMNRGAFDFITKPIDFNDLTITMEKTLDYVKQLKSRVKAIQENDILKMYVDESVLNYMGGQEFESSLKSSEMIEASVAFIDICGFTSISENTEPDHLVNLLNTYFDIMVQEIIAHNGFIDKFIGDAIMAVFRDGDHLNDALRCSISIRDKIKQLPNEMMGVNFRPEVSIGVNSGEMIFGNIGSKTLKRLDFTVLGNIVNTAQRLQSIALPSQILTTKNVRDLMQLTSFEFADLGEQRLKNKGGLTHVVEVV